MNEDQHINAHERELDEPSGAFGIRFLQWEQKLSRQSVDVCDFGRMAWRDCTPFERTLALNGLFYAYWRGIYEERRQQRLAEAAKNGVTCLRDDDVHWVQDALTGDVDINDEDSIANGVLAGPLHRVLMELELLRFKVAMQGGAEDE